MFSKFLNATLESGASVVSFDFFDTLAFRASADPLAMFSRLADELKKLGALPGGFVSERFVHLRMQAERSARDRKFKEYNSWEVSLPEIYEQFPLVSTIRRKFNVNQLSEIEESVEISSLQVFPPAAEAYRSLLKHGKKVAIVSDTYFSKKLFETVLKNAELPLPDVMFLSHEWKDGKGGGLWETVLKSLKIQPHEIRHVGDNYHADVERPGHYGIFGTHIPHGSSEFFLALQEEIKFGENHATRYANTWITSLRAKYSAINEISKDRHACYGFSILGPIFAAFTCFARKTFQDVEVDAILPFAREGIFLHELMHQLGTNTLLLDPISISRRVMRVLTLRNPDETSMLKAIEGPFPPSVSQALEIFGLTGDVSLPPQFRGNRPLSNHSLRIDFIQWILSQRELIEIISAYSARCDELFARYFNSFLTKIPKKDGERIRLGVLDIGWNGSIQNMLQDWCDENGFAVDLIGVYVMTTGATNERFLSKTETYGFLIDGHEPGEVARWLFRTLEILEQCSTPVDVGSLIGFHPDGSMIESLQHISKTQSSQIRSVQNGIASFCALYWSLNEGRSPTDVEIKIILALAQRAFLSPALHEVNLFSGWQHDENLLSQTLDPILPTSAQWGLEYMTPTQLLNTSMSEMYWPFGAARIFHPLLNAQVSAIRQGLMQESELSTPIGTIETWATAVGGSPARISATDLHVNLNGLALLTAQVDHAVDKISFVFRPNRATALNIRRLGITVDLMGYKNKKAVNLSRIDLAEFLKEVEGVPLDADTYLIEGAGQITIGSNSLPAMADKQVVGVAVQLGVAISPVNKTLATRLAKTTPLNIEFDPDLIEDLNSAGWIDAINDVPVFDAENVANIETSNRDIEIFGWVSANALLPTSRVYLLVNEGANQFIFSVDRAETHQDIGRVVINATICRSVMPHGSMLKFYWIIVDNDKIGRVEFIPHVYFESSEADGKRNKSLYENDISDLIELPYEAEFSASTEMIIKYSENDDEINPDIGQLDADRTIAGSDIVLKSRRPSLVIAKKAAKSKGRPSFKK